MQFEVFVVRIMTVVDLIMAITHSLTPALTTSQNIILLKQGGLVDGMVIAQYFMTLYLLALAAMNDSIKKQSANRVADDEPGYGVDR